MLICHIKYVYFILLYFISALASHDDRPPPLLYSHDDGGGVQVSLEFELGMDAIPQTGSGHRSQFMLFLRRKLEFILFIFVVFFPLQVARRTAQNVCSGENFTYVFRTCILWGNDVFALFFPSSAFTPWWAAPSWRP